MVSLVGQCELAGVIQSVDMLTSILLPERRIQALELTVPACLVKICFMCNDVLKRLDEYMVWLHVADDLGLSVGQPKSGELLVVKC